MNDLKWWTYRRSCAALAEGWDLFDLDATGIAEIQRFDGAEVKFPSDEAAVTWVRERASDGSLLHKTALAIHEAHAAAAAAYRAKSNDQ